MAAQESEHWTPEDAQNFIPYAAERGFKINTYYETMGGYTFTGSVNGTPATAIVAEWEKLRFKHRRS